MNFLSSNLAALLTCLQSRTARACSLSKRTSQYLQQLRFVGLDEIDLAAFLRDFAAAPDAHGVEILGQAHVAGLVGQEIFEVLEGGDQFAAALFAGDVLDGVADGQHRLGIHDVVQVAVGDGDEIAEPDLVLRSAVMDASRPWSIARNGDGRA